jgi:hypothetical protein
MVDPFLTTDKHRWAQISLRFGNCPLDLSHPPGPLLSPKREEKGEKEGQMRPLLPPRSGMRRGRKSVRRDLFSLLEAG